MPWASVNEVHLYYEEQGEGFPVVLLHGGFSDLTQWALQVPAFAGRYRTIAYDRRGCGRSRPQEVIHSAELWREDLMGLLGTLGLERVALVGVSYGGLQVLEHLVHHPQQVAAAVVVSTPAQGYAGRGEGVYIPFPDRRRTLPQVQVPVMVVQGSQDEGVTVENGEMLRRVFPSAELVVLRAGHSVNRDVPEAFNRYVLGFLDQTLS